MITPASLWHPARRALIAIAIAGLSGLNAAAAATVQPVAPPTDSIYNLAASLTDQGGKVFELNQRRGHPMLISMFYTSCKEVCPLLIDSLKATEAKLTPEQREHVGVLLVSFDPKHDTVAVLKRTADANGLEGTHWTLARTDAGTVRKLAAVLGIQYRALPDGDFNHTTALTLVNQNGQVIGRTERVGETDPDFVTMVRKAAQSDTQ